MAIDEAFQLPIDRTLDLLLQSEILITILEPLADHPLGDYGDEGLVPDFLLSQHLHGAQVFQPQGHSGTTGRRPRHPHAQDCLTIRIVIQIVLVVLIDTTRLDFTTHLTNLPAHRGHM